MKYNYTDTFRSALELATEHAQELGRAELTPDLLLWGILKEGTNRAITFLTNRQLSIPELLQDLEEHLGPSEGRTEGHLPYSIDAHEVLARAARISSFVGAPAISPLYILYSLIFSPYSLLSTFLSRHGITEEQDDEIKYVGQLLQMASVRALPRALRPARSARRYVGQPSSSTVTSSPSQPSLRGRMGATSPTKSYSTSSPTPSVRR